GRGRLVEVDLSGRQPLASAPFGEPGISAGTVRSDGVMAYGNVIDSQYSSGHRKSIAFDPLTGREVAKFDGAAHPFGATDAYLVVSGGDDFATIDPLGHTLARWPLVDFGVGSCVISRDGRLMLLVSEDGQRSTVHLLPEMKVMPTHIPPEPDNVTVA